jgi:ribonuclease-3
MSSGIDGLEGKIGYTFRNKKLIVQALTHRSWIPEHLDSPGELDNEQLEFLGDSILGFLVSESLVQKHPTALEGQLSQWKSHLVSSVHLYVCAQALSLGSYLRLGRGEEKNGGRERRTVLSNALEALIAALYLDGGMEITRAFIETHILSTDGTVHDVGSLEQLNFKSVLQEKSQALGLPTPRYITIQTRGPEHAKVFTVEARVGDRFSTRAEGTSKKMASQLAAELLIEEIRRLELETTLSSRS